MRRTDGRTHRVYLASIPRRSGIHQAVVRVLSEHQDYIRLRFTPILLTTSSSSNTITVARQDLESMVSTGLAKPISQLRCPSCTGTMTIYEGQHRKRRGVFFACSLCEERFEI